MAHAISPVRLLEQADRHDADYNHLAPFSKAAVLGMVGMARDAIAKLESLPIPVRQRFLSLVALSTSVR